ncbi:MAG TPA: patatin-like phospholipase family protein [Acidimicrobiales bacterium]
MAETTRAVVLGGGGPVGVGWEVGLGAGLAAEGVDLRRADTVIGTSAGSITGAFLAGGADPAELAGQVADLFSTNVADSGVDRVDMGAMARLLDLLIGAVADVEKGTQQERLAAVGQAALAARTIDEEAFVGAVGGALAGRPWPKGFRCTAVDTATGELAVWDEAAGVPLERAVSSSCSVPGIYPPVTIDGARYTDGGARSPINADLAAGHDVVVVVAVMPLTAPPGFDDPRFQRFFAAQAAEIDGLRAGGAQVEVIEADEELIALSNFGMSLMDFSLIEPAVAAGTRLGKASAARIAAIWQ